MKLNWLIYRIRSAISRRIGADCKKSYSQCGEDLIVRYIFDTLKTAAPSYLDIGAHHPSYLSNTRLLYDAGSRGVNVEPDPTLIGAFNLQRPKDANLNVGIAPLEETLPFYVMYPRTLNTFSRKEANAAVEEGKGKIRIEEVIQVPVMSINNLIAAHFDASPDFLSLDVEGMDLTILESLDFSKTRPKVICVETITYSENRKGKKIPEIADWLGKQRYFLYADTHVNSIFVDCEVW